MVKVYSSAMGKSVDLDGLLLKNEEVIAIGNMRVNARGDQLGFGGKVIKTRDQVMKEYYTLNTPVAVDPMDSAPDKAEPPQPKVQNKIVPSPMVADTPPEPVVINPDSGLDDIDEGPVAPPVVDAPVEEILVAPPAPVVEVQRPIIQQKTVQADAAPVFTPKTIPVGLPAASQIGQNRPPLAPRQPIKQSEIVADSTDEPIEPVIRGALASAVHSATAINQREKLPPKKANGVQRF
jgi:hypothetical protein